MLSKICLTFFVLFHSLSAYSGELSSDDFKIKSYGDEKFLQKKDSDLKLYKLSGIPHNAKVLKVINNPKAPHLYFIVYLSEHAGTSLVATFYRAVIWNEKKGLFTGDIFYQVVENEGAGDKEKKIPATWKFEDEKMIVIHKGKKIKEVPY
ncbi:MAG: hypothetical protein VXV96_17525 [Bdellovibrionota bacterium]|nr:hypothetical protein [Bdellovibrionota bacterium]